MKKSFILHSAADGTEILVPKDSLDYAYVDDNDNTIAVILSNEFAVTESMAKIAYKLEEMED
jgi:hypothetical protein